MRLHPITTPATNDEAAPPSQPQMQTAPLKPSPVHYSLPPTTAKPSPVLLPSLPPATAEPSPVQLYDALLAPCYCQSLTCTMPSMPAATANPPPARCPPCPLLLPRPHLHDSLLAPCHQQLPIAAEAAAVRGVLEAAKGARYLTATAVVHYDLQGRWFGGGGGF